MRAAYCREFGSPEVVTIEDDVPEPALGAGQLRVKVGAASVNFSDVLVVANQYQVPAPLPFVPGSEFAGKVLEAADDVTHIAVGDRVLGAVFVGAFAEQVVVDAAAVTRVPAEVDLHDCAAFGVAHRTAFHALRSFARIGPGDELVVLGAGGGVGLAAVQLGAVLGASVTAVASSDEKLEVARANGATNVINYKSSDLRGALKQVLPTGADAVIDPVGGSLSEPTLRSLRWRGRFVTVGYAAGEIPRIPLNLVLLKGAQIVGFQFRDFSANEPEEYQRGEAELMELFAAGKAAPHIGASFVFADVAKALRHVADGNAVGKVVLDIW
jgi:NADPH2:quinone reductase